MSPEAERPVLAGVDGCKGGWIAVTQGADGALGVGVHHGFADLVAALAEEATIVVDMPIGLPDRAGPGGRGPEALARRHLGPRQSSVFSIPSRAAVHAEIDDLTTVEAWYAAHRRASAVARATSDPPRGASIQAFGIFGKIREIDALLVALPELRSRVVESHPEAAFWRLNGETPMALPKKVKGAVNPAGMAERRALLARHGVHEAFSGAPPRGAAADDLLDACAMLLVARRKASGLAIPFPDPPGIDGLGIPVAIWT